MNDQAIAGLNDATGLEDLGAALPRAPLPMPKQRLEAEPGWLHRLLLVALGGSVARRARS